MRAIGEQFVREIEYTADGVARREPCDVLLVHQGVVPNANLGLSMRLRHEWDDRQRCFRPVLDEWGNASVDGMMVAGDGGGIAGALAAEHAGRIAALAAACA